MIKMIGCSSTIHYILVLYNYYYSEKVASTVGNDLLYEQLAAP